MGEVINYKCPNCTAPLKFSGASQKWDCAFCESSFTLADLKQFYQDHPIPEEQPIEWQPYGVDSGSGAWTAEEAAKIQIYSCPSCGGEILCAAETAATFCPYCHNTVVLHRQVSGEFRPDLIIPFQTTREQAKNAYRELCRGKRLLPKDFLSASTIEKLVGMYVPFWVFDCAVDAELTFHGEQISTWRTGAYQHTKTEYYLVRRGGQLHFSMVPVDGSSKLNDALMDSIEPFRYEEVVPFHPAYLSGFLADKYDQTAADVGTRAESRVRSTTEEVFRNTVSGYATCRLTDSRINIQNHSVRYLLLPVWVLNTAYQGKEYTFAMNGQTGRMVGDLPISKKRIWGWFLGLTAGISAFLFLGNLVLLGLGVL